MVNATKAAQDLRFGTTPSYIVVLGAAILIMTIGVQFFASREIYLNEMELIEKTALNRVELKAKDRRMSLMGSGNSLKRYYLASENVSPDDLGTFMEALQERHRFYETSAGWINLDPFDAAHNSAIVAPNGFVREIESSSAIEPIAAIADRMDALGLDTHLHVGKPLDLETGDPKFVTVFVRIRDTGRRGTDGVAFTSFDIEAFARSIGTGIDAQILALSVLQNGIRSVTRDISDGNTDPNVSSVVLKVADAEFAFTVAVPRPGMLEWYVRDQLPAFLTQLAVPLLLLTMALITLRHIRIAHIAGRMAEDSNFRKTRFLATMSHEMRTPLNGILGMADLLGKGPLTPCQTERLNTLTRSGEALLSHINQILDFSKIEADALELDIEDADLGKLVEDTFRAVNVLAAPRNLSVHVALPLDVPRRIRVDALRLQQVMTNLLFNAIKFTPEGHVLMRISMEGPGANENSARVRFVVEDTGIGISPDKQREIFDAFSQADVSTTRRFGGTGLGLSISQQIVTKMGGEIEVSSIEGKGSSFGFTVDLELSARREVRRRDFAVAATQNVLIAMENAVLAKALARSFERIGGFAWQVRDAGEARERLLLAESESDPFDIFLTDEISMIGELRGATAHHFKAGWLRGSIETISPADMRETKAADFVCEAPHLPETVMASIAEAVAHRKFGKQVPKLECNGDLYLFPGTRVLLVEDDAVNQMYATALLQERACEVVLAENGKAAVDRMVSGEAVDAILLDCQMPVMDGFTAAKILKQGMEEGRIARIPIIALTANALKGDRDRCIAAGMDDYLSKPLRGADLCRMLDRQLPGRGYRAADGPPAPSPDTADALRNDETAQPSITEAAVAAPTDAAVPLSPAVTAETKTICEIPSTAFAGQGRETPPQNLPVVDAQALAQARAVMKDRFARLLGMFCAEGPARIDDMRGAIDRRDFTACSRSGHTLKSSARMLGAGRVARLAAGLEEAAGRPDPERSEIAALVDELDTELALYIGTIRKHAKGSPPLAIAS